MSGLTPSQAIQTFDDWSTIIEGKVKSLRQGARAYKFMYLVLIVVQGIATLLILVFDGLLFTDVSDTISLVFKIILIILQLINAFVISVDKVLTPHTTSSDCSTVSKQYSELDREININRDSLINSDKLDVPSPEIFQQMLYYSTREQLAIQLEPLLVWIGHRNGAVTDFRVNRKSTNDDLASLILNSDLPQHMKVSLISDYNKNINDQIMKDDPNRYTDVDPLYIPDGEELHI